MHSHLIVFMAAAGAALAGTTTLTGPYYNSDGTQYNGTISIKPSQSWVDSSGTAVGQTTTSVTLTGGAFTVALWPTDSATPSGVYYAFTFCPAEQACYVVNYNVPTSTSPITIAQLKRVSTPNTVDSVSVSGTLDILGTGPGEYEFGDERGNLYSCGQSGQPACAGGISGHTVTLMGATGRSSATKYQLFTSNPNSDFRVPSWNTPTADSSGLFDTATFRSWLNPAERDNANTYTAGLQDFGDVPTRPNQTGTAAALPTSCNKVGQTYVAYDTFAIYLCNGSIFKLAGNIPFTGQLLAGDGTGNAKAATAADMSTFTLLRVPSAAGITLSSGA
jgi:hypothetical protein